MKPCCSYRQRLESSPTSPMKLLNWNTRTWVWEPRAFQALLMLVRQEDPDVLFLHQTKSDFHPEEVWYALTQMHHHKSSRPDVILEDNIQIQSLLRQYEEAFGKQVNRDKTSICLSQNTSGEVQDNILGVWNVERAVANAKYLGLPSFIGQSKRRVFNTIKDRVWKKL
ncbi:hypothetical protein I3843_06G070200 [Carya illinoinensis]|nr:hypothetical protein I3843_06G070200 [Carya illinoinensis]